MAVSLRGFEMVDEEMARILRSKTGAERLKIANDMFVAVRRMMASHLRTEHPDWSEERVQSEVSRRILGDAWPQGLPWPASSHGGE